MRGPIALALFVALVPGVAAAQDHAGHGEHGKEDDASTSSPASQPPASPPPVTPKPFVLPPLRSAVDHSAHIVGDLPSGPPPPAAFEGPLYAADAIWGSAAMAEARRENQATHGDMATGVVFVERLEAVVRGGEDGFVWDAMGWYGGDIDKFVVKTEGEGSFAGAVEDAEVQALWGHAIGPFFDLQAGVRLDLEPETRSHLVLGVQGLAPYMWHVDAAAFLSDRGDVTARIEGEYDWRLTQRLILQPRAEIELSAQDIPERATGAGLVAADLGLRLRYEIVREFAPYAGIVYERKLGRTADLARAGGEDVGGLAAVFGVRAWF